MTQRRKLPSHRRRKTGRKDIADRLNTTRGGCAILAAAVALLPLLCTLLLPLARAFSAPPLTLTRRGGGCIAAAALLPRRVPPSPAVYPAGFAFLAGFGLRPTPSGERTPPSKLRGSLAEGATLAGAGVEAPPVISGDDARRGGAVDDDIDGDGDDDDDDDHDAAEEETMRMLRFSGVGRLYAGERGRTTSTATPDDNNVEGATPNNANPSHVDIVSRLTKSTVAVIGLGGVGSWTAEALCRSGVGNLLLVDLDDVCISNTNRQLHATSSTVGRSKIAEMKRRLVDINPRCNVTLVHDFVSEANAHELLEGLLSPGLDVCVDAIDGANEKIALLVACVDLGIPIVTCGGAAGRTDPSKIVSGDLTEVHEDRLLFRCRKVMRQKHGFPSVPEKKRGKSRRVRKWRIRAVYSEEPQRTTTTGGRESSTEDAPSSLSRCDGALGTACFVTGTYGFVAASRAVEMIARGERVVPKRRRGERGQHADGDR